MTQFASARCANCGRRYGDEFGFPDLVVPAEVWRKISPRGDEGGLLCPSCMCERAYAVGIENVSAFFASGPFCQHRVDGEGERTCD